MGRETGDHSGPCCAHICINRGRRGREVFNEITAADDDDSDGGGFGGERSGLGQDNQIRMTMVLRGW